MRELLAAFAPLDGEAVQPLVVAAADTAWHKLFNDVATADASRTVRRTRIRNTHTTNPLFVVVAPVGTDVSAYLPAKGYEVLPTDPPFDPPVLGTCSIWIQAAIGTTWEAHAHDVLVAG